MVRRLQGRRSNRHPGRTSPRHGVGVLVPGGGQTTAQDRECLVHIRVRLQPMSVPPGPAVLRRAENAAIGRPHGIRRPILPLRLAALHGVFRGRDLSASVLA